MQQGEARGQGAANKRQAAAEEKARKKEEEKEALKGKKRGGRGRGDKPPTPRDFTGAPIKADGPPANPRRTRPRGDLRPTQDQQGEERVPPKGDGRREKPKAKRTNTRRQ